MIISSIKHPLVEEARLLQTTAGRKETGKVLLYDEQHIQWALRAGMAIEHVFVKRGQTPTNLDETLQEKYIEVSEGILKKISGTSYVIPYMGVARATKNNLNDSSFVVVLDQLLDFGNIGSIVRSARAFSVDTFILSGMDADPYQRKVIDTSRGLVLDSSIVQISETQHTIALLKEHGYYLVATSPHATIKQSELVLPHKKIALIVGNETHGICDAFLAAADVSVKIPMSADVESLNVSVSTGISLYELRSKQNAL